MIILAFEFSSARRSVALVNGQSGHAPAELLGVVSDDHARSAKPLTLLESLLTQAGVQRERIEALVVGLGPGSYTGIRSAIALAQGWQLARGIRTWGVSSVESLAFQAQAKGWFGNVSIVIDAQRDEFYIVTYSLTPTRRDLIEPLRLVDLSALRSRAEVPGTTLIGPDVTRWCAAGRILIPEAATLAFLTPPAFQSIPSEELEPIYLRKLDFVKAPPARVLPT